MDEIKVWKCCVEIRRKTAGDIEFILGTDVECYSTEVGYGLAEPYWNRDVMSRALKQAVEDYLLRKDVMRIHARAYAGNRAPMRVLKRVGFRKCGISRRACFKNRRFVNSHCYELFGPKDHSLSGGPMTLGLTGLGPQGNIEEENKLSSTTWL